MTLRAWVRRLEARREGAVSGVGERTSRVWRLCLAAAAHGFARGRINIVHSLLLSPYTDGSSGLPLTREALYREACPAGPGDVVLPSRAAPGEPRGGRRAIREH